MFTARALSIKLKMKMWLNLCYLLLNLTVSTWGLLSLTGIDVASQFLKEVKCVCSKNPKFYLPNPPLDFIVFAAQHLLRTDPVEDKEGFFIALFTKHVEEPSKVRLKSGTTITSLKRKRCSVPFLGTNLFKMWLNLNWSHQSRTRNC